MPMTGEKQKLGNYTQITQLEDQKHSMPLEGEKCGNYTQITQLEDRKHSMPMEGEKQKGGCCEPGRRKQNHQYKSQVELYINALCVLFIYGTPAILSKNAVCANIKHNRYFH